MLRAALVLGTIFGALETTMIIRWRGEAWLLTIAIMLLSISTAIISARRSTGQANFYIRPEIPLRIAKETLPYLRRGLNEATAGKTAEIILKISQVAAVAITDQERVLAYLGAGCDKHQPGDRILTEATRQVLGCGQYKVVHTKEELHCTMKNCNCPLEAAVIVPLKFQEDVVGTLKLYQTRNDKLPPHVIRLATGIGQLMSLQMELAELDHREQLLTTARLDALRAQINPHFLFNTLNTIISYTRTNPQRSRRLLIHLANYFRHTMKTQEQFVTLEQELESVHTYLVLEKARYGKKLQILQDVDPTLLKCQVPALCLQPLVENAVKHGLAPKLGSGAVRVSVQKDGDELVLGVIDDGVGIPPERLPMVLEPGNGTGNGVGMSNVNQRLNALFGNSRGLKVTSSIGSGTWVYMRIPFQTDCLPQNAVTS